MCGRHWKRDEEGKERKLITEMNGREREGMGGREGGLDLRGGKRREDYEVKEEKSRAGEKTRCNWIKDGITHNEGVKGGGIQDDGERKEKGKGGVKKENRRGGEEKLGNRETMRRWE